MWSMVIVVPRKKHLSEISALGLEKKLVTNEAGEFSVAGNVKDMEREDKIEDMELRYGLRSRATEIELTEESSEEGSEKSSEKSSEESSEESVLVGAEDITFDSEDLQGASFDDALETIEGKHKPESIAGWPSEAYRDFMELVVEGNISNRIGDNIIRFFNKYSNLEESPLPKTTKSGKDYLNDIKSPSVDFKEKVVATYSGVEFTLYYHPIFRAIQTLLQRPGITDSFVRQGILRKQKVGLNFFGASRRSRVINYILPRMAKLKQG